MERGLCRFGLEYGGSVAGVMGGDEADRRELAKIVDIEAVERIEGSRAKLAVDVPPSWLAAGATVDVVVPPRLVCERCDGGGCDGCGRSGAVRVRGDESVRTTRFVLPQTESGGVAVRLVRPLGDSGEPALLVIEIRPRDGAPSAACRRVARRGETGPWRMLALVMLLLASALALSAAWR